MNFKEEKKQNDDKIVLYVCEKLQLIIGLEDNEVMKQNSYFNSCHNLEEIIGKIVLSGYKGKITVMNMKKQIKCSFDLKNIEKTEEEKTHTPFLIPSGGTTNWLINCHERNYRTRGYTKHLISEINISYDSRIEIKDYTQPGDNGKEEFFTSITFFKKELDKHSIYAPSVYDRAYSIYYPYGTRFNSILLRKIGYALSGLINEARDLNNTRKNQKRLLEIYNQQKQLIELFINGTNDEMVVEKIMGSTNIVLDHEIREARVKKDWLPYFTGDLFIDFTELEQHKVLKKEKRK